MISHPSYGFCLVKIGDWSVSGASYLEDYPLSLADALLLSAGKNICPDNEPPDDERFRPVIDCEGDYYTVEFRPGQEVLVWDGSPEDEEEPDYALLLDAGRLSELCHELAADIKNDWLQWVLWEMDVADGINDNPDMEADELPEFEHREKVLEWICSLLEEV